MTKKDCEILEKCFSEMTVMIAFGVSIVMLALCCFAIWILIDEKSAVTFIFQGAIAEPIFVGEYSFLKWWLFVPMPLMIPWIIYKIVYIFNHMDAQNESN